MFMRYVVDYGRVFLDNGIWTEGERQGERENEKREVTRERESVCVREREGERERGGWG